MKKVIPKPAKQRVIILPDIAPEKVGAIYIPPSAEKDAPRIGTVAFVGTGDVDIPMEYWVGQRVAYSKYSGVEIELDIKCMGGLKTYLVMNQLDIMMSLKEID